MYVFYLAVSQSLYSELHVWGCLLKKINCIIFLFSLKGLGAYSKVHKVKLFGCAGYINPLKANHNCFTQLLFQKLNR